LLLQLLIYHHSKIKVFRTHSKRYLFQNYSFHIGVSQVVSIKALFGLEGVEEWKVESVGE